MYRLIQIIIPPKHWMPAVIILLASIIGLSIYTAYIAKAFSYLSDDPKTCVNCHVMYPQYATWFHSSHGRDATCNDCHVPHNNVFNKYFFKAKDGLRHSTMFALRLEPQVIFIKEEGAEAVQENCERCHAKVIEVMRNKAKAVNKGNTDKERRCWDCHREVPHGRVNGLSSTPHSVIRMDENPVPEWLSKMMKK